MNIISLMLILTPEVYNCRCTRAILTHTYSRTAPKCLQLYRSPCIDVAYIKASSNIYRSFQYIFRMDLHSNSVLNFVKAGDDFCNIKKQLI